MVEDLKMIYSTEESFTRSSEVNTLKMLPLVTDGSCVHHEQIEVIKTPVSKGLNNYLFYMIAPIAFVQV